MNAASLEDRFRPRNLYNLYRVSVCSLIIMLTFALACAFTKKKKKTSKNELHHFHKTKKQTKEPEKKKKKRKENL